MDPDATYRKLSTALTGLQAMVDLGLHEYENGYICDAIEDARQAFEDLTYWLTRGGYLPREWQHAGKGFAPSWVDNDNPKV